MKDINTNPRQILLVDDDPFFGRLMQMAAETNGDQLTYCRNLSELCRVTIPSFDAILLDYDLGAIKGSLLADMIQKFFHDAPVVIVSASSAWWFKSKDHYPACIRGFVHKDAPIKSVLHDASQIADTHWEALEAGEYKEQCEPYPELDQLYAGYRKVQEACGNALMAGLSVLSRF